MERSSEHNDLATALAELRPTPDPGFVAELDELVAAGFPRRSRLDRSPLAGLATRLRGLAPRRLLIAGGGAALAAIAIATVVVASLDLGVERGPVALERHAPPKRHGDKPTVQFSSEVPTAPGPYRRAQALSRTLSRNFNGSGADGFSSSAASTELIPMSRRLRRNVERSAAVVLLAEPDDVASDASKVFDAVHAVDGIVLRSTTTTGTHPGARFELLVPSPRLSDALAAFSAIDEVRSRHEATDDITAPTVATSELLRDSRARIDGLLAQLSSAETEAEMEAIEVELRGERRHAATLRAQLASLHKRADLSRVTVRIESSGSVEGSGGGGWGVDDAFGDAGRILGVAAGVTLIAFALLVPLVLACLLAWLAHRAWLRRARARALG